MRPRASARQKGTNMPGRITVTHSGAGTQFGKAQNEAVGFFGAFATGSVTLPVLAEHVNDLTALGLIGA
jgi:hypothetical protein